MPAMTNTSVTEPANRFGDLAHVEGWNVSATYYPRSNRLPEYGPKVAIEAFSTIDGAILSFKLSLPVGAALELGRQLTAMAADLERQQLAQASVTETPECVAAVMGWAEA